MSRLEDAVEGYRSEDDEDYNPFEESKAKGTRSRQPKPISRFGPEVIDMDEDGEDGQGDIDEPIDNLAQREYQSDVVGYGVLYKTRALRALEAQSAGHNNSNRKRASVSGEIKSFSESTLQVGASILKELEAMSNNSTDSNGVGSIVDLLREAREDPDKAEGEETDLKKPKETMDVTKLLKGAVAASPRKLKASDSKKGRMDPSTAALLGISRTAQNTSKKTTKKVKLLIEPSPVQLERNPFYEIFASSEKKDVEIEEELERKKKLEEDELEKAIKDKSKYVVEEEVEFAGEKIKVKRILQVGSKEETEYKKRLSQKDNLAQIVESLKSKKEISTLDKTKIDWAQDKEIVGDAEELAKHAKDGYLSKQEFLLTASEKKDDYEREVQSILLQRQAAAEAALAKKSF